MVSALVRSSWSSYGEPIGIRVTAIDHPASGSMDYANHWELFNLCLCVACSLVFNPWSLSRFTSLESRWQELSDL